jgi:hypothetical protein
MRSFWRTRCRHGNIRTDPKEIGFKCGSNQLHIWGSDDHSTGTLGSMEVGEFVEHLGDYHLSAPWLYFIFLTMTDWLTDQPTNRNQSLWLRKARIITFPIGSQTPVTQPAASQSTETEKTPRPLQYNNTKRGIMIMSVGRVYDAPREG